MSDHKWTVEASLEIEYKDGSVRKWRYEGNAWWWGLGAVIIGGALLWMVLK